MTSRMVWLGLAISAATVAGIGPGSAQTSLFSQPLATEAPATPEAAPAQQVRKPRPKPRGPVPARALTITNDSANTLTTLEVTGEGKNAKIAKPLAPKAKATLKLPAMKQCVVSVSASFEGSGAAEANDLDICKEKSIRFTE